MPKVLDYEPPRSLDAQESSAMLTRSLSIIGISIAYCLTVILLFGYGIGETAEFIGPCVMLATFGLYMLALRLPRRGIANAHFVISIALAIILQLVSSWIALYWAFRIFGD